MPERFERFLEGIPIGKYREELTPVKTVEQDLKIPGHDLNPLPLIYRLYWENQGDFPDFEKFFETYWKEHLSGIDEFIGKYFWGCSRDFVRLGFKARLYRTWAPVLTQFHFAYLWKEVCKSSLEASAEMDRAGTDFRIYHPKARTVDISFKKISRRREASERRFPVSQVESKTVELVYTLESFKDKEDFLKKMGRAKSKTSRLEYCIAFHLQRNLKNGFVVFREDYPMRVEKALPALIKTIGTDLIHWQTAMEFILKDCLPK